MMELLRQWLLGLTAAALLGALAQSLLPRNGPGRVGRLATGLVMLLAMVGPVASWLPGQLSGADWALVDGLEEREEALRQESLETLKGVIEEQCAAYIVDKAVQMGLSVTVQVEARVGEEGYPIPSRVTLTGAISPAQREELSQWLTAHLGIPPEGQNLSTEEDDM